ncbi:unnamed protein product [Lathyrus oleraceus]
MEEEVVEVETMKKQNSHSPAVSTPPQLQIHSPNSTSFPKSPFGSRFMNTPIASPMKKAIENMFEEVGEFTRFDPRDDWLPITASRNGNAYYAAFHVLCSGIGFQALVLPLAFTTLGWIWGILCLCVGFTWQLYTLWLLIQLHESELGVRHSRYLKLAMAAFGEKLGKILVLFPIQYLSGGTCVTLIMIGGGTMKILFQILCGDSCSLYNLKTIEWYLVFTVAAILLAQLPNLNSFAGVSLIGAITGVGYCSIIWIVSLLQGRIVNVPYESQKGESQATRIFGVLNALGIIAFAFRGHNLVLEIQGTIRSESKNPSRLAMWKGVMFAYLVIAFCLFPLAIAGYWSYGNLIPSNGGMLSALQKYHEHETSKFIIALTSLLVVVNSLTSFQIYAMPILDNLEFRYISKRDKPCPRTLRIVFRCLFGCLTFFISVALPFLPSLAGLLGGIALPITLAYPCFMWILIKKPKRYSTSWYLNSTLGAVGMVLSVLVVTGAIWGMVALGIQIHFFNP